MSFASMMSTGALPEKPWRPESVARLFVSAFICGLTGGAIALAVGYEVNPSNTNPLYFAIAVIGAFTLSSVALLILSRPWPLETLLVRFILTTTSFYGAILLIGLATHLRGAHAELQSTTLKTLLGILCLHGVSFLLIHRFLREHALSWNEAFGFKQNWSKALLFGTFVAVVIVPLTWSILAIIGVAMEILHIKTQDQLPVQMLKQAETKLDWWLVGAAMISIVPAAEEILFRGILYPAIKRAGYPRLAVWCSAAAFATIHLDVVRFLPLMVLALALVWLYEYTGNLIACITVHALFNASNFIALYLTRK
jgi:membrane protease YdiL (CAAX protease family)